MSTLFKVKPRRDREKSPCIGLTSDALPKVRKPFPAVNSDTGVFTKNARTGKQSSYTNSPENVTSYWYALRTTYGREKKAYDYLTGKGIIAFYPTLTVVKQVDGKRKTVEESRIPNIFFAYGTEEKIRSFVYDNVNLPYLRFYYRHVGIGKASGRESLAAPDGQMKPLRIICKAEAEDIVVSTDNIPKFQTGQLVRVIEGKFKGVTGIVARYQGQQRVEIVIDRSLLWLRLMCRGRFWNLWGVYLINELSCKNKFFHDGK